MDTSLRGLLEDLKEYMDQRADTKDDPPSEDGPSVSPNEEMAFAMRIEDALQDCLGPYKVSTRCIEVRMVIRQVPAELTFGPYEHRTFTRWGALTQEQQLQIRACAEVPK